MKIMRSYHATLAQRLLDQRACVHACVWLLSSSVVTTIVGAAAFISVVVALIIVVVHMIAVHMQSRV